MQDNQDNERAPEAVGLAGLSMVPALILLLIDKRAVSVDALHETLPRQHIDRSPVAHLIRSGDALTSLYLVDTAWILRSRHFPGCGLQIAGIAMPDDFPCLSSLMFETSGFDLVAKTAASGSGLSIDSFRELMQRHQGLPEALVRSTAQEEALLAERVVSLGSRAGSEWLTHVFCKIVGRVQLIGRHDGEIPALPLIQKGYVDILPNIVIDFAQTLKRLAAPGAVEYRTRMLALLTTSQLRRIADATRTHCTSASARLHACGNTPPGRAP